MLIGNLTRDPELRYTPQGTAVCSFGLATNRSWISDGQQQEDVEFHRIVAWQKLAELCSQLLFKGRKAFVEGRLQTRQWTDKEGQQRQTTEIVIDSMIVLDAKRKDVGVMPDQAPAGPVAVKEEKKTVEEKKPKKAMKKVEKTIKEEGEKPAAGDEEEKVSADDIPF